MSQLTTREEVYGQSLGNTTLRIKSDIADIIRTKYEVDNYLPFNEFDKFGITDIQDNKVSWKRGTFYAVLLRLDILCQLNSVYIPCPIAKAAKGKSLSQDEEYLLTFFERTANGKWGFNYASFPKFLEYYFDTIVAETERYEQEVQDREDYRAFWKSMKTACRNILGRTPTNTEVDNYIRKTAMKALV